MARIWQEGFEDGLPNYNYLEGIPSSVQHKNWSAQSYLGALNYPSGAKLISGRNAYSLKSLMLGIYSNINYALTTTKSAIYFRMYIKYIAETTNTTCTYLIIRDTSTGTLLGLYGNGSSSIALKVKKSGVLTQTAIFAVSVGVWTKTDVYLNTNSSSGGYEVKINDVSLISESTIDTGSLDVQRIIIGNVSSNPNGTIAVDDIALNDTSGSVNNSWCGNGTIVSLKPKAAGNKSQWDTCQGYAIAESGSGTTTLKITGHGLATNDVIYNKTREAYRIVTATDANTLTVSSITGQTQNDIILMYNYNSTITATTGTAAAQVVLSGHTLISGDVFVNTTRSNAIRKVIYVNSNNILNYYDGSYDGVILGSYVTSQASGDSIKTFKFKPYTITNHWSAVSNTVDSSPQLAYVQSTTSGDIDTYDMEELTADKSIPSSATIVAASVNIYAQEAGSGSEIKPVLRISSTDYEGGIVGLSSGTLQYQTIYETSPATSVAFTRAEIDAIEAGVKLV